MKKLLVIVMSVAAMGVQSVIAAEADPLVAEARATAMKLGKSLKMTLQDAIKTGGPVAALDTCNTAAPAIAETVSAESGWDVARTSLKERNPGNAPDEWELAVLNQFEQRKLAGEAPATLEYSERVSLDGIQTFRYMKAIPTEEVCMNCHGGDNVKAEVVARLKELYPDDKARGFKAGDLRGAFTLSKPL
jgi:hypothetical protein